MFRMNGYVQDERYIAKEHMDVRRDCVNCALHVNGDVRRDCVNCALHVNGDVRRDCVSYALHVTGVSDIIANY